jgi:hypothetical protein
MPVSNPLKILFLSAQPDNKPRLEVEFDNIRNKISKSLNNKELELLNPTYDTDYEKLLSRLNEERPKVLHFSCHANSDGICLINNRNRNTQMVDNEELFGIFEDKITYLSLIFLNSCFSSYQAETISKAGLYVLGLKEEIGNGLAKNLAECFYFGFDIYNKSNELDKAIKIGCTNFVKSFPEHHSLISLWKDGVEIDYRTLKSKVPRIFNDNSNEEQYKIEGLKNSILHFNYQQQLSDLKKAIEIKRPNIFIFHQHCCEEAKFIFRVIENDLANLPDTFGIPKFEVITVSKNLEFDSVLKSINEHLGDLRKNTVAICLRFMSKDSKSTIDKIISEYNNYPPLTKKYPFLLFLLPEKIFFENHLCVHITHSAQIISKRIYGGEINIINHIEEIKTELKKWVECHLPDYKARYDNCLDTYINDYFEGMNDTMNFFNSGDKHYIFTLLKEFTQTQLKYDISFRNDDLKLELKEWKEN